MKKLAEIISAHSAARIYEEDGIVHAVNDGNIIHISFENINKEEE